MRILGLDYGAKTVGVAVSDPLGLTAQGVEIIRRQRETKLRQTLARIEELAQFYHAEKIVLGLPRHMNGDIGERAEKALAFRDMLEKRLSSIRNAPDAVFGKPEMSGDNAVGVAMIGLKQWSMAGGL